MTHEQIVSMQWFTAREIAKALACEIDEAQSYCDKTDGGRARGGYGMNILTKIHPLPSMRTAAARNLAHYALGNRDCPVC